MAYECIECTLVQSSETRAHEGVKRALIEASEAGTRLKLDKKDLIKNCLCFFLFFASVSNSKEIPVSQSRVKGKSVHSSRLNKPIELMALEHVK